MAYVSAISDKQELAAVTTTEVPLAAHASGDLLLVFIGADSQGASGWTTATSGWTRARQQNVGTGTGTNVVSGAWFWKWATSGAEPNPVITLPVSDTCHSYALTIKDAYYTVGSTEFIDIEIDNTDSAGPPYEATSITTTQADSLIIIGAFCDGAIPLYAPPPLMTLNARDDGAAGSGIFMTVKRTAGATGAYRIGASGTTDEMVIFKIAIRNATGGKVPAFVGPATASILSSLIGTNTYNAGEASDGASTNLRGLGAISNPQYVFQDDGGVFTDYTTAATNATDADVIPFPATEVIGDALYVGLATKFAGLSFDRAGCTNGVAGVVAKEYWNGSAWVALQQLRDATSNFTAAVGDRQVMGWTIPSNWATTTVNGQSAYWVRFRVTTVYTTNPNISQIFCIEKKANEYDATAGVGDTGVIPFQSSLASTPPGAGNVISGDLRTFGTTAIDGSTAGDFIMGTYLFGSPRQCYNAGSLLEDGGVFGVLVDNDGDYRAWRIGSFNDGYQAADARNVFCIEHDQSTDTKYASAGTFNSATLRKWYVGATCVYGATALYWYMLWLARRMYLSGGTSSKPITFDEAMLASNLCLMPVFWRGLYNMPIQIGGVDAVACDWSNFAIEFPRVAADGGTLVHLDPGLLGVYIDARAGDVCKLRAGLISSKSKIAFELLSSASGSATYDFSGLTVVNANVVLRSVVTFDSMSFVDCTSFTQNGAAITNSSFSNCKITSASPGDADNISNCSFTSAGTGHAIEIGGTAANMTLSGVTFSGYAGTNGSTGNEAIYVNIASGSMTINISGGGSTPSIRTAGCTVTVVNSVTLTLTGLQTGSDIVILEAGTSTVRTSVDAHGASSYGYAYTDPSASVDIGVFKAGYVPLYVRGYTLGASDSSLPIAQVVDRAYLE
jgi:hypothetical protein